MDESPADDGALHHLFGSLSAEQIALTLLALRRLAAVRGPVPLQVRLVAEELADSLAWPLRDHPVVARILEAP